MTVALAIRASNGVVIAADTQYSGGIKSQGPKIFQWNGPFAIAIFAFSGHIPNATTLISNCRESLDKLSFPLNAYLIRDAIRQEVKEFQEGYIDTRPYEERADAQVDLIVAIGTINEGISLYYSEKSVLTPFDWFYPMGTGGWRIGHYFVKRAYRREMSVDDATILAMQVLAISKNIDADSGGESVFATIMNDGMFSHIVPFDVGRVETDIVEYHGLCSELLLDVGDFSMDQEEFTRRCRIFNSRIQAMRENWMKHGTPYRELIDSLRTATQQSIAGK
jgi:20S proteasome alpha/beta subunit